MLNLLSVAPHGAVPALVPSDVISLVSLNGVLTFQMPATPVLLERLAAAIRDKALVAIGGNGLSPSELDQVAALVAAQTADLHALMDRIRRELLAAQVRRATASAAA